MIKQMQEHYIMDNILALTLLKNLLNFIKYLIIICMGYSLCISIILLICLVGNGSILTTVPRLSVISSFISIISPKISMSCLKFRQGNHSRLLSSCCVFYRRKALSWYHSHSENSY